MAEAKTDVIVETFTSPTNIAVIKYWGKRDSGPLNLPLNSSVSVTLNQDDLYTITTVAASKSFPKDRLWLNGREEDVASNKRVSCVLQEIRKRAGTQEGARISAAEADDYHVHIVSKNTFPTAAGLASSAAGYACLTRTLAEVFGVKESYEGELSSIARIGSGSASRSLDGGFVRWNVGTKADGTDSVASQVAPAGHWPELEILILVVSAAKKDVGSTAGMSDSVNTSELLKHRVAHVVEPRLKAIEDAYKAKDFPTFAKIAMQDSNQFHAVCADTYPPIYYMNDVSRKIVNLVHKINAAAGEVVAGYTYDAGPNAVLLAEKKNMPLLLAVMSQHFDIPGVDKLPLYEAAQKVEVPEGLRCQHGQRTVDAVRNAYHTNVGDGPRHLEAARSLVGADGLPKEA